MKTTGRLLIGAATLLLPLVPAWSGTADRQANAKDPAPSISHGAPGSPGNPPGRPAWGPRPAPPPVPPNALSNCSAFHAWTERYLAAPPKEQAALLAQGKALAQARQQELLRLIPADPRRALELAVPYRVRKQLPATITPWLEEPVSGRGDYKVAAWVPAPGSTNRTPINQREITIHNTTYHAYVYDWRLRQRTTQGIPFHGIAVSNLLAMHRDPARVLEPEEAGDAIASGRAKAAAKSRERTWVEVGKKLHPVGGASEAATLNELLITASMAESVVKAPETVAAGEVPPVPNPSWTQGRKTLLFIRARCVDDPSEPVTEEGAYQMMNDVNDFYVASSYNSLSIISTVTPLVTLPQPKAWYWYYGGPDIMEHDAREAAKAIGFNYLDYDLDVVYSARLWLDHTDYGYSSRARGIVVMAGAGAGLIAECLGLNFGLNYADTWITGKPGDPRIPGNPATQFPLDPDSELGHDAVNAPLTGYGNDPFDLMGGAGNFGANQFNALNKYRLRWLPDQFTRVIRANETNRLYAFDAPDLVDGRLYALRIQKDVNRQYWLDFRQLWTGNPWLSHGVELHWPSTSDVFSRLCSSELVDSTPGTAAGFGDAAVVVGRTFYDEVAGLYLTPVAEGGAYPDRWIDVVVQFGPFPANNAPTVFLTASELIVTNGATVTFTATATDPDGDKLAYYWEYSDHTFGVNSPVVSRTFTQDGYYVARCEVTDTKGGLTSAYVVVTVGTPNTFTMNGFVMDVYGSPVQGMRVHNGKLGGAYRYAFTDSQGNYTITDLPEGSYTNRAFLYGYHTDPMAFYNPVTVSNGSAFYLDHLAVPIPQVSIRRAADADEGSGAPGSFIISRTGDVSSDLGVSFRVSGTAQAGTHYADFGTTNLLIPAGLSEVNLDVLPMDNGASDGPLTVTVTLGMQRWLTNVVEVVSNGVPLSITNLHYFPGWELLTENQQKHWYQTYPVYVLGNGEATLTIIDSGSGEPVPPAVSILPNAASSDETAVETGSDYATVWFSRSGDVSSEVVVHYSVGGTASNGVDYIALPGTLTIPAGQALAPLSIVPIDDLFVEGNETVTITLLDAPDGSYVLSPEGTTTATVTILDDDLPLVTVNAPDGVVAEAGGNTGIFTMTRSGDFSQPLLVNYLVTGTAISGVDYQALPGSVLIPAGQLSIDIPVQVLPDSLIEGAETVTLILSDSPTYNIGSPNRATAVIQEGAWPTITLEVADANAAEPNDPGAFTLRRTGPTTNSLMVAIAVGGTAVPQADYATISTNVMIPVGTNAVTITIMPIDDNFRETNETVIVQVMPGTNYNVGTPAQGTVTIDRNDDSELPEVSFMTRTSSVLETDGQALIPIRISAQIADTNHEPVVVEWHVQGGTATNGPADTGAQYSLISTGYAAFEFRGLLITNIDVNIWHDGAANGDKTVILGLFQPQLVISNQVFDTNGDPVLDTNDNPIYTYYRVPTNALLGSYRTHTLTIIDVDTNVVSIEATDPQALEAGQKPGLFTISRTGDLRKPLTVFFDVGGTAAAGNDYVSLGNSVTIPAGTNLVVLQVIPLDDPEEEDTETVHITLARAPGADISPGADNATVYIIDDDGTLQFLAASFEVREDAGTAVIGVMRSGRTNVTASVDYLIFDGTATSPQDYEATNGTLTFAPGEVLKTFSIQIKVDTIVEPAETILLALTNASGGVPLGGQKTATLFILDDDTAYNFSASTYNVNENAGSALITIDRVGLTDNQTSIHFSATNGTATAGSDFVLITNQLVSFGVGETSKTVMVTILDDTLIEGNETVKLLLSGPSDDTWPGSNSMATLVIVDDECSVAFAAPTFSTNEYAGYVQVVVTRTGGTVNPLRVDYATSDGTATNLLDYYGQSGTLEFSGDAFVLAQDGSGRLEFRPGETTKTIQIQLQDDVLGEGNETFFVTLSNLQDLGGPAGSAVLGRAGAPTNATVIILDNETPGNVDYEYNPGAGANGRVLSVALQPDGKAVFGGEFTTVDGLSFNHIARLQANGYVDTSFNPGLGANSNVLAVAAQADGKVLLGGAFTTVNGTNRTRIARLNNNGTLDTGFASAGGPNNLVRAIAVQPDGKVLIGGDFDQVQATARRFVARFNANGTLDTNFNASLSAPVFALALQADGKILVGGGVTGNLTRLQTSGVVDSTFDPGTGANGAVNSIAVQADGRIVIAGAFTRLNGTNCNYVARLNTNGSPDLAFSPGTGPNAPVNSVAIHPNGRIHLGGDFTTINGAPRARFARLKPSGGVDSLFDIGSGANASVRSVAVQSDTAVILGGEFTMVNDLPRNRIARIHGDERSIIIGLEFSAATYTVWETNSTAAITLLRSGNTNLACNINVVAANGTATAGADYVATNVVVSFAPGELTKTVSVRILDDALVEGNETVNLFLTNAAANVDLSGVASAVLTILDNERTLQFSAAGYRVDEGATNAIIAVTRAGGQSGSVSVTYLTGDGTAVAPADYTSVSNTLTFADGETNKSFVVPIVDDIVPEVAETVNLFLVNPVDATLGDPGSATLTILDNDAQYGTFTYANTNQILITDATPAYPYPSVINIHNLTGVVSRVVVTLVGFTHTFPADVDVLLVGPQGQSVLLMSDAGGSADVFGATLQFADSATTFLPELQPIVTSTNKPTDYPSADIFFFPAPPGPYGSTLSVFDGTAANGNWSLFIVDDRGVDSGVISNGWRLTVTTIDPARVNDLALSLEDAPDPLRAGDTLTYTLSVANNGPLPATQVRVTDTLPANVSRVTAVPSQGSCTNTGGTVVCDLGSLPLNSMASVQIQCTPGAAGTITNSATVSADEPDVNSGNNSASVVTTVTPAVTADIAVTITDSPDPVLVGQNVTYVVVVRNNGPLDATGVVLTNWLPAAVTFLSASVTQGTYVNQAGTLVFDVGSLANGQSATATVVVRSRAVGAITNAAIAQANELDVNPNNQATAVTTVAPAADLAVVIGESSDPVSVNSRVIYTVTVFNNGPSRANGVTLFDTLPAQMTFVSATASQGTNFAASGTIICDFGSLNSGESAMLTIVVLGPVPGTFVNQATVIASEADPFTPNNNVIEETTVFIPNSTGVGIIDNGVIQLGVYPQGHLNVPGGQPSSGTGTRYVGLRYLPTGAEATAPGCLCEGWGVADNLSKVAGYANESVDGIVNLTVESFTADGRTATSVVRVNSTNDTPWFRVTHYYHPSVTSNLYQVDVTIENISPDDVEVLYRRVMDWDVEPTAFAEYSTIIKGDSPNLAATSNDGFATADPLVPPTNLGRTGTFIDYGPKDQGALFQFNFGILHPGEVKFFRTYYGAASTEAGANLAIARVGAEAYSYGQPSTEFGPSRGTPNTFIFAFGGIGGTALAGSDLAVGMTVSANPVALGDTLTYTITLTNRGPDPATGVTLSDNLPADVSLVSLSIPGNATSTNDAGLVTVNLGNLLQNEWRQVRIVVIPNREAFLTNIVSAVATEPDGNTDNNTVTSVVPVLGSGTFVNTDRITIADAAPAIPYPSVIRVVGMTGVVTKVTATLLDITHAFPADIDVLLVGPGGESVILMSDAGQGDDLNGVTLKFDDAATNSLPATSRITSGVYRPTNYGNDDAFRPPAPGGPYGSTLSVFDGTNPNGDWLLYVVDDQGSDAGFVASGWRLTFTTGSSAPPPRLTFERAGLTAILSWPAAASGYVLESTPGLAPAAWAPVSPQPSIVNGRYTLTVDISSGTQFYRVRKP